MGLWDSIKGAVNTLTGGQATVALEVGEATLGEDVFVRVKATAKTDISIDGVYLLVKASEFGLRCVMWTTISMMGGVVWSTFAAITSHSIPAMTSLGRNS